MYAEIREQTSQVPTTDEIYRLIGIVREGSPFQHRVAALTILGSHRDPRAVIPIAECCRDEDADIRRSAIRALHQIKSVRSVPALIERLKDRTEHLTIRKEAAAALADIRAFHILEPLIELSLDPTEDPEIRMLVGLMLGRTEKK
ncbi:MAG TPA: HEAT repeat domain-containing protein [Methanoregulaceae archaeon]|nr:MAG: HEAT repeat domain-containing protein [Methanolinea sp.]HON82213.1 HEAT repeat domain-containing protein [Methanoregulaceae archaeon]HPD09984.1 HEAT repeat domain-containing protein [Methanoregulaceae archaeon]HRT14988.1 HEAT repeat domain-containing protein [Methanoregulaceae archaeon]HRU30561.1 HEAT repeat domain-containing protein [Methanoregulaceae archaeon]